MNKKTYIIVRNVRSNKTLGVFDISNNNRNSVSASIIQYLFNKKNGMFAGSEYAIVSKSNVSANKIKTLKRLKERDDSTNEKDKLKKYYEETENKYRDSIIGSIKEIRDNKNTEKSYSVLKYLQINSRTMGEYISIEEIDEGELIIDHKLKGLHIEPANEVCFSKVYVANPYEEDDDDDPENF